MNNRGLLRLVTDDGDPGPGAHPVVALFCGSRKFRDRTIVETLVHGVLAVSTVRGRPLLIVEGEAEGADIISREEAESIGIEVERVPADWVKYKKAAGPIRNQLMLKKYKPEIVIAFADDLRQTRGTKDMCQIAAAAGVPVYVVGRFQP